MSKRYCEETGSPGTSTTSEFMRELCQRPGKKDEDGNPIYFTEQNLKDQCDVNNIIRKYDKTGLILHVTDFEAQYGDMTGLEFKTAQDKITKAKNMFNDMPMEIRKRFRNSPAELLEFMEHEHNRPEAEKLGLINPRWTEDTDGIGEHVKKGEQKLKTGTAEEQPVPPN